MNLSFNSKRAINRKQGMRRNLIESTCGLEAERLMSELAVNDDILNFVCLMLI
jgi:hypothetical protein